jgi:hypothetical protein
MSRARFFRDLPDITVFSRFSQVIHNKNLPHFLLSVENHELSESGHSP